MPKRNPGSTLTDKEKMFCKEYIIDLDATQAAIRAGYGADSATSTAYHLKQKPEVEAYIDQLIEERSLRLRITADDVLLELAKIGFAEIVKMADEELDETPRNSSADEPETKAGKNTAPGQRNKQGSGKGMQAYGCRIVQTNPSTGRHTVVYFSLSAKIAALKLLGKHVGLFGKEAKPEMGKPIIIAPRGKRMLRLLELSETKSEGTDSSVK